MMDEAMAIGLYLVLCAGVGFAIFIGLREFVRGFMAAKTEVDTFQRAASNSSNRTGSSQRERQAENANSAPQGKKAPSSRPWFDVLGISPGATLEEIKTAYRQKISLYHPDRVAGLGEELRELAEVHAKEINAAYASACRLRGASG
jgi:DnaJ-domain-containing protein 1